MGSHSYIKEAICNIKKQLSQNNLKLNRKLLDPNYSPGVPFSSVNYKLELHISLECDKNQTNYFQNLIGILRWIVELGRIDIAYEVSSLSKFLAWPRTGHTYQALLIFKYLKTHIDNNLAIDPLYQNFRHPHDPKTLICEMKKIHVYATEDLLTNAPQPRGKSIHKKCFVDADRGGDRLLDAVVFQKANYGGIFRLLGQSLLRCKLQQNL